MLVYDNNEGLTSEKLSGTLWGEKVSASIKKVVSKKSNSDLLSISAQGLASVESLQNWIDSPVFDFFSGESKFDINITLPYSQNSVDETELVINSTLNGIALDLPEPFGKIANIDRSLSIMLPLEFGSSSRNNSAASVSSSSSLLDFNVEYANIFNGVFSLEDKHVKSAAVNLSSSSQYPPSKPRISEGNFLIKGKLSNFVYETWLKTYEAYLSSDEKRKASITQIHPSDTLLVDQGIQNSIQSSASLKSNPISGNLKPVVNIDFEKFVMSGFDVDHMHLNAYWSEQSWVLNVSSDIVSGDLIIFDDESKPLVANLMHLHILTDDYDPSPQNPFMAVDDKNPVSDALAEINPKELPSVDFSVSQFTLNKENYGSWSFNVEPTSTGVQLKNITGEIRGGYVIGNENETGATLRWDVGESEQMRTVFSGRFVSDKFEDVLKQWGQPELLESEAAKFDAQLSWNGSPAAVSTLSIAGSVKLMIEKGSFYQDKNNPSAGGALLQLISFFNFDTWVRRLRLDFSDLTRKGMAFDQIEGELMFEQGIVLMDSPLVVRTPSGRFQVVGEMDLNDETVDAQLVATLPVGGNLTLFTALAAGLPAAVGVYIISKIFEKQVDKVASVRYSVKGRIDDPDFEFDKLFGNKIKTDKTE